MYYMFGVPINETYSEDLILDVLHRGERSLTVIAKSETGHEFEFDVPTDVWEEAGYELEDTVEREFSRYLAEVEE